MKKIAMLTCLKSNTVCTGAACMKAFYERTKSFARYEGQDVMAAAFMKCNGCGCEPDTDKGLLEKMERLVQEGVLVVHAGKCTKNREGDECPVITKMMEMMSESGIEVVRGTH